MKKFFAMMMAMLMSISCLVVSASASNIDDATAKDTSTVEPKQILTYSKVHRAYVGSSAVDITLKFTARDDAHNTSGYYITGILNTSIKNVTGWHSVGSVKIDQVSYSDNHQFASVRVTYEASGGSGLRQYTTTISVNTHVDC